MESVLTRVLTWSSVCTVCVPDHGARPSHLTAACIRKRVFFQSSDGEGRGLGAPRFMPTKQILAEAFATDQPRSLMECLWPARGRVCCRQGTGSSASRIRWPASIGMPRLNRNACSEDKTRHREGLAVTY